MRKQELQNFTYHLPGNKPYKFFIRKIYCELGVSTAEANLRAQGIHLPPCGGGARGGHCQCERKNRRYH
jgi:hypothetical protein